MLPALATMTTPGRSLRMVSTAVVNATGAWLSTVLTPSEALMMSAPSGAAWVIALATS